MEIEAPATRPDFPDAEPAALALAAPEGPEVFATIGEFYEAVKHKIAELGDGIFTVGAAKQVTSFPGLSPDLLFPITDVASAARAIGAKNGRIMWRVILPNALPPLIVSATLTVGVAILFEAGLSFLGLGDPNTMSWGLMIGSNREYILQAWWPVTFPGLAIFLTV